MTTMNHYIPLARKYRPTTFAELSGQDSTATSLANAILLKREPHAVIFSGVRGIGKTTSARLYAKALNCESPVSAEPCNQCESCQAITLGIHEDVMEIDGASNTSVDDVRTLKESISYVPQRSKFKVYIIDEVHMLSQSAFNALLKTLEEPPAHVVFIFATTELQKIPQTIMSRCQLFHLQRLSIQKIRDRIVHILHAESLPFEDKAVVAIAREGRGSMRDALTLLDHVIAIGRGSVTSEALSKIVTHASSTQFLSFLNALVLKSPSDIVALLDEFENSGINMRDVAEKIATVARHAFIIKEIGIQSLDFKLLGLDDDEVQQLAAIAKESGPADLNQIFRTLTHACTELDGSALDRFIVENYCFEWCLDPGFYIPVQDHKSQDHAVNSSSKSLQSPTRPQQGAITQTRSVANIRESIHAKPTPASAPANAPTVEDIKQGRDAANLTSQKTKSLPETWRDLVELWKKYKPLQAKRLEDVHPVLYTSSKIELVIPTDSFLSAGFLKLDEQKKLKDAFLELFGFTGIILFTAKKSASESAIQEQLPETVSSIQQREQASHREKILMDVQNNPVTKDALHLFNATIDSIEMNS
jgi:DNA polymerase III subunit gamma/tau